MSVKSELRKALIVRRKKLNNKEDKDKAISAILLESKMYRNAEQVLFYAALADEINVDFAIQKALNDNKRVALPRCIDSNGRMKFYYISSLDELESGSFGVREPEENYDNEVLDFTSSICIVPALSYDMQGFRLGYGKGYYDRFLQNYTSISVGLCYNDLISEQIPADEHDLPVGYIITEKGIYSV